MRHVVEEHGFYFLDMHAATLKAAFPADPASSPAAKFDRNSAFHWLDAGRYLMSQILMHALRRLAV